MNIKKIISPVLAVLTVLSLASGCGGTNTDIKEDPNTLTITLGVRNVEQLTKGLTAQFPDINFIIEPTYCCNQSGYLRQTLITDHTSDIFYYSQKPDNAEAAAHLLDLSGYDFISNYDRAILNNYAVNGRIYTIPGPLLIRGIAYNKTLFEEHGWNVPKDHAELVALCRQIRSETADITPIAMSFGGVAYPFSMVSTLSQAQFLCTPAGESWEENFLAGNASVAEGWGDGLKMTAELIDAGAFNPAPYIGVWDGNSIDMEFAQGKAAMFVMWAGQSNMLQLIAQKTDCEYAFIPFLGQSKDAPLIGVTTSFTWGLPKRLGEPGNEKKLENALRVLEWFSTPEGQDIMKAVVTDENDNLIPSPAEMSPLNLPDTNKNSSPYFTELWNLADKGNKALSIYSGYESVIVNAGTIVQDAMLAGNSEGMIEKVIASADRDYKEYLAGGEATALGEATQDFTEAETAQLLADVLNDTGLGDFALITHTGRVENDISNRAGAAVRLFAGQINNANYNVILGNIKALQTLTLTGAQVKELLSDGKKMVGDEDKPLSYNFPYYWSGIDVTRTKDGSIKSVKLNGTELDDNGTYKVVFCNGDYTEEIQNAGDPVDSALTFDAAWMDYLKTHTSIAPPTVSRK